MMEMSGKVRYLKQTNKQTREVEQEGRCDLNKILVLRHGGKVQRNSSFIIREYSREEGRYSGMNFVYFMIKLWPAFLSYI